MVIDMSFCTNCGHKNSESSKFCGSCGASLSQNQTSSVITAEPKSEKSKKELEMMSFWEKMFYLIDKAGGKSINPHPGFLVFILQFFKSPASSLPNYKSLSFYERMQINSNIPAFFLGPFYYIYKGMWKKAITITIFSYIIIALISIIVILLDAKNTQGLLFVAPIMISMRANTDYYKKVMFDSNSWF